VALSGAKGRARGPPSAPAGVQWSTLQKTARFFGKHEHSLDLKGRVILPARFRESFDGQGFLSNYRHRCLALWTNEEWEKQLESMEAMQQAGDSEMNLARVMAAGSVEVDIDKQGRLAIPPFMREYARLENDVLINGALNRVELWSPAVWGSRVQPSERELTGEED
jgi:MraZ protein